MQASISSFGREAILLSIRLENTGDGSIAEAEEIVPRGGAFAGISYATLLAHIGQTVNLETLPRIRTQRQRRRRS